MRAVKVSPGGALFAVHLVADSLTVVVLKPLSPLEPLVLAHRLVLSHRLVRRDLLLPPLGAPRPHAIRAAPPLLRNPALQRENALPPRRRRLPTIGFSSPRD